MTATHRATAAGQGAGAAVLVTLALRLVGVNVEDLPPEGLVALGGAAAAVTAAIGRLGLVPAVRRVIFGPGRQDA